MHGKFEYTMFVCVFYVVKEIRLSSKKIKEKKKLDKIKIEERARKIN